MFSNRKETAALKKASENLKAESDNLRQDMKQLRILLGQMEDNARALFDKLDDAEPTLLRYEEATEKRALEIATYNDAQAGRYLELKKRLDAYEVVFKQLGLFIAKQPVITT